MQTNRSLPPLAILPILGLATALLAGCATVMSGTTQDIRLSSSPDGAGVVVYDADGVEVGGGRTPLTIPLDRGDGYFTPAKYRVVVRKAGYADKEFWIRGELNGGWYVAGNFLIGGPIGWLIVDPLTGAMWSLSPSRIAAGLEVAGAGASTSFQVTLAEDLPDGLLDQARYVGTLD